MKEVIIYKKPDCIYCDMATQLLNSHDINHESFMLGKDFTREEIKEMFPTATTFPIILIEGVYIGGHSQLREYFSNKHSKT